MAKALSAPIAIGAILLLAIGGIVPMLSGYPLWSYILWCVGLVWLLGFFIYLKQKIDIDIHNCIIKPDSDGNYLHISVEGFVNSRHADGLINLRLLLYPNILNDSSPESKIPHSINSKPQLFRTHYSFGFDLLRPGREEQEQGKAIDIAWLCAQMRNGNWLSVYFRIPMAHEILERKVLGLKASGKLSSEAKRKTGRIEISREEYHEILKKASQTIKKRPPKKEKS